MEEVLKRFGKPKLVKWCPLVTETVDAFNLIYDKFMVILPSIARERRE